jgi:para-nitrobenzyl esterase
MTDAWVHFARTGNPNHRNIPRWPSFTPAGVETMIFDEECTVERDHDRPARLAYQAAVKA